MPLVFLSYMSSVLFIWAELGGILEKARTWGSHLPAASSPENRERHFAHGDIFASWGKTKSFRQEDFGSSPDESNPSLIQALNPVLYQSLRQGRSW